ncbi:hypothetical protein BGZ72_006705 [Mortierella alpina]|nr:hypothetical protein BGZ72_006705 [Mortierella alpina]
MVKLTTLLLASVAILACSTSAQVRTESHSSSVADFERFSPVDALKQMEAAELSEEEANVGILPFPAPNNSGSLLRRAERTQPEKQKKKPTKPSTKNPKKQTGKNAKKTVKKPTKPSAQAAKKPAKPSPKLTKEQQLILNTHNRLRARHQAPPLVWNNNAAKWGDNWIRACKIEHSSRQGGKLGENLAWGTRGMFKNFGSVINAWYDEEKGYNYNNPDNSRGVTGHFTQVVWRETKSVGCAKRFCPNLDYEVYICNYSGAGNMGGRYARNVLRPRN